MDRKFVTDVAWTYGSMALIGAGGILLNAYVAVRHGPLAIGVFNQVYAVFIILAQLSAWGMHYAAQKHVTEFMHDRATVSAVVYSAVGMAALSGMLVTLVVLAGRPAFEWYFDSVDVSRGLLLAAPGLLLIALNKVLLGSINGLRHMRAFSVLQALRMVLLAGAVAAILESGRSLFEVGAAFSLAELGVTLGALLYLAPKLARPKASDLWVWGRRQLPFATRSFPTGLLLEANFRIDVVVLGACASDATVGIYSLAATVAEGLYNLLHVLRVNVNPLLVDLSRPQNRAGLQALVKRLRLAVYPGFGLVLLMVLVGGYIGVYSMPHGGQFAASLKVLAALCVGIWVYAGFAPFDFILLQAGQPGHQTLLVVAQVVTTLAINLALVPSFGVMGAAWAMAISFVLAAVWLAACVARWLRFNLVSLAFRGCPS